MNSTANTIEMGVEIDIRQFKQIIHDMVLNTPTHAILGLGGPGIGKSESVAQVAAELGYNLIDLRLAQMSEVEIGGLIFPDKDTGRTHWLTPDYFPTDNKTILLLDEITSAPKRVQVAAYQLVLDHKVGQNKLPDGTIIIALGNREDDGGVYVELAAPLANRFEIYNIQCNTKIWLEDYAENYVDQKTGKGINPLVTSFIREHPSHLNRQEESSNSLVFATPRSWKRVSDVLNTQKDSTVSSFRVRANLGDVLGSEFLSYISNIKSLPTIDSILNGEAFELPKDGKEILYINSVLLSHFNELVKTKGTCEESVDLYGKITKVIEAEPADYAASILSRCAKIDHETIRLYDVQASKKGESYGTSIKEVSSTMSIFGGAPADTVTENQELEDIYI